MSSTNFEQDWFTALLCAQEEAMPARSLLNLLQVIAHKLLDQLDHAVSVIGIRRIIYLLFHGWQSVCNGHRAFTHRQERVISFVITNTDHAMWRPMEFT